jgi:hypothetical protein
VVIDRSEISAPPLACTRSEQWYIQLLLCGVFVVLITSPLASQWLSFSERPESAEKRTLAPKPVLTVKTIATFPAEFDEYYSDHFSFRNTLIRWNSLFKIRYLKVSPVPSKVIIGKKGWLFYADEGALDNYKRTYLFTTAGLQKIKDTVDRRNRWLKGHGIAYYLMLAPEKQTIYPEFMPDSIRRAGNISTLDQVVAYLAEQSTVKVVDVRKALWAEKARHPVFRRIDTHWNQYGAFIAADSLLRAIAGRFPVILPPTLTDFSMTFETVTRGDLVDMLALGSDVLSERVPRLSANKIERLPHLFGVDLESPLKIEPMVVNTMSDTTLPRLVMFRDSFATPLIPFISAHFSRSVYVWSFSLDTSLIAREKPHVVVDELNERYLGMLIRDESL